MALLCPENSLKSKAAHPHTKTTVREEVRGCHKKFVTNFEQKEGAIAAFFQPVTIMFYESLDLRLREGERIERYPKTIEQFLKRAVPDHFIDLHRSFFGRQRRHVAAPMFEIGINVFEDVPSLGKRFLTIVRIEHQWLLPGNELETFIHGDRRKNRVFLILDYGVFSKILNLFSR